jgi:hypothetical protein
MTASWVRKELSDFIVLQLSGVPCLIKSITTGTNHSINGSYQTPRHGLQIAGGNWYRRCCCYSFVIGVIVLLLLLFLLLFSSHCLRNRFIINSVLRGTSFFYHYMNPDDDDREGHWKNEFGPGYNAAYSQIKWYQDKNLLARVRMPFVKKVSKLCVCACLY